MTQSINQSINQSLRRCRRFLKCRRSVVTKLIKTMTTLGIVCSMTSIYAVEYKECSNGQYEGKTPQEFMSKLPGIIFSPYQDSGYKHYYTYTSPIYLSGNDATDKYTFKTTIKVCFIFAGHEIYCGVPMDYKGEFLCEKATIPQALLSLTPAPGQTEPRPKGSEGDGKSTYDLIAKVTEGNQPKAGMALTFTAEVEAGSGNHPLNPPKRPPGILSVTSGTTNASGEVKVTFTSPIFAGTHKVKVTCAKCTGTVKEAESKFNVKVPNLTKIPASINWRFISNDNYHKNNNASTATQTVYYLTQPAHTGLVELTKYMVEQGWKTNSEKPASVGLNDASLEWGGKFYSYPGSGSIYPNWTGIKSSGKQYAHVEHRIGIQIDLRTSDLPNELKALKKQMYDKICNPQDGKYPVQAKILWHTGVQKCKNEKGVLVSCTGEHYHAYLLGNISSKLGGGQCSSTPN